MAGQLIEPRSEFASFVLLNGLSTKLPSKQVCLPHRLVQLSVTIREGSSLSGQWLIERIIKDQSAENKYL